LIPLFRLTESSREIAKGIRISIKDHGIGIPESKLNSVFATSTLIAKNKLILQETTKV